MRPASQRFFIHNCIHLRILIISNLEHFLALIAFLCCCAVKQSINQCQDFNIAHSTIAIIANPRCLPLYYKLKSHIHICCLYIKRFVSTSHVLPSPFVWTLDGWHCHSELTSAVIALLNYLQYAFRIHLKPVIQTNTFAIIAWWNCCQYWSIKTYVQTIIQIFFYNPTGIFKNHFYMFNSCNARTFTRTLHIKFI